MFKRCDVHIGTEKTGTTSIQESFKLNRNSLNSHSIFTPLSMGPREHVDLVCLIADSDKIFSRRVIVGAKTRNKIEEHKKNLHKLISAELTWASKKFDRLVISSERLCTMITRPHELDDLIRFLSTWCEDIRVICYLRPQHEFAISAFSTGIRNGRFNLNVLPRFDRKPSSEASYLYADILDFWLSKFELGDIQVRTFERHRLLENDIVKDFWNALDLPESGCIQTPREMNLSLSAEAQIFLAKMNKYMPSLIKGNKPELRSKINKHVEALYPGEGLKPTKPEARAFVDRFSEQNERVRSIWFKDRKTLFDLEFEKYPTQSMSKKLSEDKLFEMFAKVYLRATRKQSQSHKRQS